jgi:hypothetical protein
MAADPSKVASISRAAQDNVEKKAYPFNAVCHEPVEALDEKKESKHNPKWYVKLIPKDCEGKQALGYKEPDPIV